MGCLMGIILGVAGFFVAGPVGAIIGLLIGILGAVGGNVDEIEAAFNARSRRRSGRMRVRRAGIPHGPERRAWRRRALLAQQRSDDFQRPRRLRHVAACAL